MKLSAFIAGICITIGGGVITYDYFFPGTFGAADSVFPFGGNVVSVVIGIIAILIGLSIFFGAFEKEYPR